MDYIAITEKEIAEALWNGLVRMGYAPSADELFDISMIVFEYLREKVEFEGEFEGDDDDL
jgi:hypothetical protein